MASKEIFGDPWKQDQVNLFGWEQGNEIMIVNKLNIFSQNVCKNSLIVNSILKTHNDFDIILIQELPCVMECFGPNILFFFYLFFFWFYFSFSFSFRTMKKARDIKVTWCVT